LNILSNKLHTLHTRRHARTHARTHAHDERTHAHASLFTLSYKDIKLYKVIVMSQVRRRNYFVGIIIYMCVTVFLLAR